MLGGRALHRIALPVRKRSRDGGGEAVPACHHVEPWPSCVCTVYGTGMILKMRPGPATFPRDYLECELLEAFGQAS